jgi:hypothetical protein
MRRNFNCVEGYDGEVRRHEDKLYVDFWYPREGFDGPTTIQIELMDVRAADDLLIRYDFDRDGYTIARGDAPEIEVAFIRSWAEFDDEGDGE